MNPRHLPVVLLAFLVLAGCATTPTGPSRMALPGSGKNFDQFRVDDQNCRAYAYGQASGSTNEANQSAARNAAIGTVIGAAVGAAIGGRDGAAVGAGSGLLIGSVSGAEASQYGSYSSQRLYDNAYVQCMYARGHRVPVSGQYAQPTLTQQPPPAAASIPPPPPGSPPPPPPSR